MGSPDFTIAPEWESLWTVGALDGEDWEVFGDVADLVFNEAGDLFVLDEQAGHVVVLDRAGAHLRTISRQGEGPGELTEPRSMALLADWPARRLRPLAPRHPVLHPGGRIPWSRCPSIPSSGMPTFVRGWLPDGSILTDRETRITSTADGGMSFSTNSRVPRRRSVRSSDTGRTEAVTCGTPRGTRHRRPERASAPRAAAFSSR